MAMFEPEPVAPEPGPIVRPRQPAPRHNLASTLILGLAAVVAVGGLAFAAGRITAPTPAAASTGFDGARNGTSEGAGGTGGTGGTGGNGFGGFANGLGAFRGAAGGFGIRGTVTAVAADHLTLQLTNGTTIDIPISSATTYHQQTAGTASEVQVGKQVQIQLSRPTGATASPGTATGAARLGTASDVTVLGQ